MMTGPTQATRQRVALTRSQSLQTVRLRLPPANMLQQTYGAEYIYATLDLAVPGCGEERVENGMHPRISLYHVPMQVSG